MPLAFPDGDDLGELTEADIEALTAAGEHAERGAGYAQIQSTRPQSLGFALNDSPAGQAAWILEMFWTWTDHDGDLFEVLDVNELLDNIMFYWLPGSATSSARLYWESYNDLDKRTVDTPTSVAVFPKEIFPRTQELVRAAVHRSPGVGGGRPGRALRRI